MSDETQRFALAMASLGAMLIAFLVAVLGFRHSPRAGQRSSLFSGRSGRKPD